MVLSAVKRFQAALLLAIYALSLATVPAAEPAWWSAPTTKIWQGSAVNADNYAPINVGQLKHMAAMAKEHLSVIGGAGSEITSMVGAFSTGADNFAPANVGQLKAIAAPFYKRFAALSMGYSVIAQLRQQMQLPANGFAESQGVVYPWVAPAAGEHHAPATVGQLKMVFGFSLTSMSPGGDFTDTDLDGLYDAWEMSHFSSLSHSGLADNDGDGVPNWQEQHLGYSPTKTHSNNGPAPDNPNDTRPVNGATSFPPIATDHRVVEAKNAGGGYYVGLLSSPNSPDKQYRSITVNST